MKWECVWQLLFVTCEAIARNLGPAAPYIVLIARFFSGFDNGTRQALNQ